MVKYTLLKQGLDSAINLGRCKYHCTCGRQNRIWQFVDIKHGFHLTASILRDSFQSTITECQLYEGEGDMKMNKTGLTLGSSAYFIIKKNITRHYNQTRKQKR